LKSTEKAKIEQNVARSNRFCSWLLAVTLVWPMVGAPSLYAGARARQSPKSEPQTQKSNPAPAQTAPAQTAPQAKTCPDGSAPVKQATPFGSIDVCGQAATPAAPAQQPTATPADASKTPADAPKPTTEPAKPADSVTVTTGTQAQQPAPSTTAPAPPQQKPAETPEASKESARAGIKDVEGGVALNLENADLYQVLRILGPELKINTIIDPAVKGVVTINTSTTVTRKDLFGLLEMILEINGATAVRQPNGYYAIVPLGTAKQQPLDFQYAKRAERTPGPEEGFTLTVVAMKFMPAGEMAKILTPFMSPAGQIVLQDKGNILLISESAAKIQQLREIIGVFDDPVLGRQRVRLIPVKNNLAANLIPELKSIFAGYGLTSGNAAVQMVAMDRQNAILAISGAPEVFKEVEEWVDKLDQPVEQVGIRNFVYNVQNAKASDLADIVNALYGGTVRGGSSAQNESPEGAFGTAAPNPNPASVMGPTNNGPATATATATVQPNAQAGPAAPGQAASSRLEGSLRIMADAKNNLLIVQATPHDYDILERTLGQLDVLPRQVLIDARIYEVDLTGDLSLGISAFLDKKANQTPINTSGSFNSQNGFNFQTFAILHNAYQLQVFLNATENRTRVKTLSAPSILVTDNTPARVQVGSEVPVPIGSALTPVTSGGSSIFAQTIQMRDVGVILTVTPRINASGIVTMNIAQEVSSAQPNATSAIVAPVINKSQFQTTAILRDGETLALGGIINQSTTLAKNRIPLLGDIPGVGALFGTTTSSNTRKELVLLITPHVARDMGEANAVSTEFMQRLKILKKDMKAVQDQQPKPESR